MPSSRLTIVAALGAAVLLSGCGASVATSPPAAKTTTTSPPPGTLFNPQLVPPPAKAPVSTAPKKAKPNAARSKTRAQANPQRRSTPPKAGPARTVHHGLSASHVATTSSAAPVPPPAASTSSGGGGTRVLTITRTITVTRVVPPSVPAGAHVPSPYGALGFTHFAAAGGNIGCRLSGATVRCDVGSRVWSPPGKPRTCGLAWGQGLEVGPSGSAQFVCAGDSALDPTGPEVPIGRDDRVGSVTCQVRSFGVTCFDASGQGFFISRTGYATF